MKNKYITERTLVLFLLNRRLLQFNTRFENKYGYISVVVQYYCETVIFRLQIKQVDL